MTYLDVIDFFGKEDRTSSEMLLKLSILKPVFRESDLLEIFTLIKQNYHLKSDLNETVAPRPPLGSSPLTQWFDELDMARKNRTYYHSDIIFRNLWRIMFETNEWDSEILFQPDFFGKFSAFVESARPRKKSKQQYNLDFWEAVSELMVELSEKIKLISGV